MITAAITAPVTTGAGVSPPAATGVAALEVSRLATTTATTPLAASRHIAITACGAPLVRSTFDAPTLPLPTLRRSMPRRRATRYANGTDPTTYASATAITSS